MSIRNLTCIGCPLGCTLTVTLKSDGDNMLEVLSVTGNTCEKGDIYARKEITNPTRIVTSTVRVLGGNVSMANVKTESDIPKEKIFDCVKALRNVVITAPVRVGDVIVENVADTGVNVIAARNVMVYNYFKKNLE